MNLRLLRAFVTLADLGHFGRAADLLCITQPTLSKQMRQLESELGARLFERGRHGAQITAAGTALLPDARRLLQDGESLQQRARLTRQGAFGTLRLGFGLSTLSLATRLAALFQQQHAGVRMAMDDFASAEQTRRLLTGELDVGFIRLPSMANLETLPLLDEQLALCLPPDHPWQTVPAEADAWAELNFIALSHNRGPGLAAQIRHWSATRHFQPSVTQFADDLLTVHAMVKAGLGAALLPWHAAQQLPTGAKLMAIDDPAAHWQIGLAWRAPVASPLLARFIEFVRATEKA
ncbi:LysR family transcriptional regulator [Paludibacterium purpuratum]|uniref:LysR family transcriptional regulator n=1 Tax=Paludibacterium purpuratum TaxID=1144873 RepID=A0A4R7B7B0_9NEIS|nr:LysR family transcriptional regulator [Paludibacterium purpuratum]TDR80644.1 LysR family transcriptional regulator [Paludibacterium purpuratum]